MVYRIQLYPSFAQEHRRNSAILFKILWTNLGGLFSDTPRVFQFSWGRFTVENYQGFGWFLVWILPFSILHENLHLLIAYFTPRDKLIRLIPPVFDLVYLPISIILISANYVTLGLYFAWVFIIKLENNIPADFGSSKNDQSENPQSSQPEIDKPVN